MSGPHPLYLPGSVLPAAFFPRAKAGTAIVATSSSETNTRLDKTILMIPPELSGQENDSRDYFESIGASMTRSDGPCWSSEGLCSSTRRRIGGVTNVVISTIIVTAL